MTVLLAVVVGCWVVSSGFQVFQLVAARRFFRRARRQARHDRHDYRPFVSILKPLKGEGLDLQANLASFCRQAYPNYEIIIGVEDPDDPALAVVERVRQDFPEQRIIVSIGQRTGTNRKVANLIHMMEHATGEVLVLSDADIRVRPDYLKAMIAPLADAKVGLSTCLYRGRAYHGAAGILESLLINTDSIPMFISAEWVQGLRNAYGASIAFKRQALDDIGGFRPMRDHLADDYVLGAWIAAKGWRLVLIPHIVETVLDATSIRDVWRHQVRWARTYRAQQPVGWFSSLVIHAMFWGIAMVLVTGGSVFGWAALATAVVCRVGALAGIMRLLKERDTPRLLWLVPFKDLAYTGIWLVSWLGRDVEWAGHRLRVHADGRMERLDAETLPPRVSEPSTSEAEGASL